MIQFDLSIFFQRGWFKQPPTRWILWQVQGVGEARPFVEGEPTSLGDVSITISRSLGDVQETWGFVLDGWRNWSCPRQQGLDFFIRNLVVATQIFFYFHPYLRKGSNLTNIFQVGWNHQLGKWAAFCQACLGILCSFWWYRPGEFGATVFFWSTDPRSKGFLWIPNCYGKHPFWDLFPAHWAVHQRSQGEGWFLAIQNSLAGGVLLMFPDLVLGIWVDMYTYIYIVSARAPYWIECLRPKAWWCHFGSQHPSLTSPDF